MVKHLRTFGCVTYAHLAKDERQKLDSKERKCIFLGYGTETKGYRLYDPKRARVFYSQDVLFKEPSNVQGALASPDKAKWINAMETEIESLHTNDVWDLVELPKDRKAVGSK